MDDYEKPLEKNEIYVRLYNDFKGPVRFIANNYFINEKNTEDYKNPTYALVAINKKGDTMVVGLEKEKGVLIAPDKTR